MDFLCAVNRVNAAPIPAEQFRAGAGNRAIPSPGNPNSRARTRLDSPARFARRRRSSARKSVGLRVSSSAATGNGAVARRASPGGGGGGGGGDSGAALLVGKSSAAMEQLDIERGVCIPFRKYTPDTVRKSLFGF